MPRKCFESILLIVCLFGFVSVHAQEGYDYARKKARQAADDSNGELQVMYKALIEQIRASKFPDAEHNAMSAQLLEDEHKAWLSYRNSHCWLEANIYSYPAGSKQSGLETNSCLLRLNKKRKNYLEGLKYEFNQ